VWEGLWKACGRSGTTADFLKGLIKLAAAGVKHREGRNEGVRRHAARAVELFESVARQTDGKSYAGLDVQRLSSGARQLEQHIVLTAAVDSPVNVVFDFLLVPRAVHERP
jgi:hypothetical protein